MENRVRDLDQLEERDPEERGRSVGMVVLATLGIVGLTFAIGVVVGKAAEAEPAAKDPLDQLDRVAGVTGTPGQASGAAQKPQAVTAVDAADLSFPKSLTEDEDRPEVLAALAAAAREEETLDVAAPAPQQPAVAEPAAEPSLVARDDEDEAEAADDAESERERAQDSVQAVLPASVAAGSAGQKLAKAAKHDQLVAAALPEAPREQAAHGTEGEFTLQVISYDASEPAQAFARGLRAKGHEAFVAAADVEGRGRYYRVRIGPFKTRDRADAYRRKFEDDEHMNTIVVKRAKDDIDR